MDLWITVAASIVSALLGAAAMWMVTHRQLNRQETYDKNKIRTRKAGEASSDGFPLYIRDVFNDERKRDQGSAESGSVIVPPELMSPRAQQEIDMPDDDEMRSIVRIHEPSLSTEMEALFGTGGGDRVKWYIKRRELLC